METEPRQAAYESRVPWDPTRPETLVICCVDGRWFGHVQDFIRHGLGQDGRIDMMAVPGGAEPLTLLDYVPKDFNFFRRRVEGLLEAHGTRRILAIGHQDCAWYKSRRVGPLTIDLNSRQITDLRRAARRLREIAPQVSVETYFARLAGAGSARVVFERV